ncbi:MAG TPA: hypothetical protein VM533_15300 [Fimbriiglobus sp.]|nr:hypothetical protein [Fimbriiglobus sp.]
MMPAVAAERWRRIRSIGRGRGARRTCWRWSSQALTRKQVIRALRSAGLPHGPGTVSKPLADLTAAGESVNPRDKRGYRMPDWARRPPASHPPCQQSGWPRWPCVGHPYHGPRAES